MSLKKEQKTKLWSIKYVKYGFNVGIWKTQKAFEGPLVRLEGVT